MSIMNCIKDYEFAVRSYRYNTYFEFKKACEKMGWKYNHTFNRFSEWTVKNNSNCMFFSFYFSPTLLNEDFDSVSCLEPMFSLSNTDQMVYDLDKDFDGALLVAFETIMRIKELSHEEKQKMMEEELEDTHEQHYDEDFY